MASYKSLATGLLQLGCLVYAGISLLYTTYWVLLLSISSLPAATGQPPRNTAVPDTVAPMPRIDLVTQVWKASHALHMDNLDADKPIPHWSFSNTESLLYLNNAAFPDRKGRHLMEGTLLAKAYSQSMHPTRIIPFYYKATAAVDEGDVTITTLVTSNRYNVLRQLVDRYRGPISVTIHIPLPPHDSDSPSATATRRFIAALKELESLYTSSPYFAAHVDVHLALSPYPRSGPAPGSSPQSGSGMTANSSEGTRQFNVWRNIARLFARTEFVLMLDVDFAICTDWRTVIREAMRAYQGVERREEAIVKFSPSNTRTDLTGRETDAWPVPHEQEKNETMRTRLMDGDIIRRLQEGQIALVLPAFEYVRQQDGLDQSTFPTNKQSLIRLSSGNLPANQITTFHASWAPGHNSTDYAKFFSIVPGVDEVYEVTRALYQSAYEPYVITSKRVTWCDERFTGYGGNKAACLFEMYLSGVTFYVLSEHFLIHQSHTYEEEARKEERKYNRKLYADFKEETCLGYLYKLKHTEALHTHLAANALEECKKIRNVVKIASEFIGKEFNLAET